jgi:hypothetical protein
MISIVSGTLLEAKEDIIVPPFNCLSTYAQGLTKDIFDVYPCANVYQDRQIPSIPGTIVVEKKKIIGIYGQYAFGKPNAIETSDMRKKCFSSGLHHVGIYLKRMGQKEVAFLFEVGGMWEEYSNLLAEFATEYQLTIHVYKVSEPCHNKHPLWPCVSEEAQNRDERI